MRSNLPKSEKYRSWSPPAVTALKRGSTSPYVIPASVSPPNGKTICSSPLPSSKGRLANASRGVGWVFRSVRTCSRRSRGLYRSPASQVSARHSLFLSLWRFFQSRKYPIGMIMWRLASTRLLPRIIRSISFWWRTIR
ncbi:hypothetical protein D3C84_646330 [compost metagenome]